MTEKDVIDEIFEHLHLITGKYLQSDEDEKLIYLGHLETFVMQFRETCQGL